MDGTGFFSFIPLSKLYTVWIRVSFWIITTHFDRNETFDNVYSDQPQIVQVVCFRCLYVCKLRAAPLQTTCPKAHNNGPGIVSIDQVC